MKLYRATSASWAAWQLIFGIAGWLAHWPVWIILIPTWVMLGCVLMAWGSLGVVLLWLSLSEWSQANL